MNAAPHSASTFASWRYTLLGGLAIALLAPAASFCLRHGIGWTCPMRLLFHIPCPSCGSTRAMAALSRFEFAEALRFNPLLTFSLGFCLALPFFQKVPLVASRHGWLLLGGALFLNWLYLLLYLPP
jgi:hypothetical protein